MKQFLKKILFFDRTVIVLSIAVLSAGIFTVVSFIYSGNIEQTNIRTKTRLTDIQSLAKETAHIKTAVNSRENKIGLRKTTGVVSALEKTLKSLGIEARALKPLEKKRINEFIEENAELEVQGANLNSIVNLLYKIEVSPYPMKIKNAALKTTFEDPDKFILKLTVSLMSKR
jgi:hypothetical protein